MIGSRHGNDSVIAVGSPACLVDVALTAVGRNPGGRAAALNIDDNAGNFRHDRISEGFLHQRETGATGGRHDFTTGKRSADYRAYRCDLIFHLDKLAAGLRKAVRQQLGNFG